MKKEEEKETNIHQVLLNKAKANNKCYINKQNKKT